MDILKIEYQIFSIGLLIFSSYLCGKIARKLKIGEVLGQIFGGILAGPFIIGKLGFHRPEYQEAFKTFHFIIFLFLGVIAFSIGEELYWKHLKKVGGKAIIICLIQAGLTWILITGTFLLLKFDLSSALIIGSIGIATAPAVTFVLMNIFDIEGKLRNLLGNIVVLDDVIEVIIFSLFLQLGLLVAKGRSVSAASLARPVIHELFYAVLIGAGIYVGIQILVRKRKKVPGESTHDLKHKSRIHFLSRVMQVHPTPSLEILFIIISLVSIGIGVSMFFNLPFLITAVVAGILVANFHSHILFDSLKIDNIMPFFNLIFFALIGANMKLETINMKTLGFVVCYIAARGTGKVFGTWLGTVMTGQDKKIVHCLPQLMLPQTGVAAVEAYYVSKILPGGEIIFQIVIPAIVFFEFFGVLFAEKTLIKWRSWTLGEEDAVKGKTDKINIDLEYENKLMWKNLTSSDLILLLEELLITKNSLIRKICEIIKEKGFITNATGTADKIIEREQLASTGFGNGIAVPHCRTLGISHTKIFITRLEKGIDFKAMDKKPVDLIFLVISPVEKPKEHLACLARISHLLADKENLQKLRSLPDTAAIYNFIVNPDKKK